MIEPFENPFFITQPLLPTTLEMNQMIKEIWESHQLSNNGSKAQSLESELSNYLGLKYLSVFANGTIALELAIRALRLSGEVITTPFTFAATTHALNLNNIKPVFCDIEDTTLNMNPDLIESLITKDTTAIMPVHVFGNPCNVLKIQQIADKYGLKVLYDAAHAFGVKAYGKPIASYGDISMFSFHATKIYHTIEGGALCYNNSDLKKQCDLLKNFGIQEDGDVVDPGTNGKMNEVQAAVGLLLLKHVEDEILRRKEITYLYRSLLENVPGISFSLDMDGVSHNYAYFVIRVDQKQYGLSRDDLYEKLKQYNVIARKYFYPICSNFTCYKNLPSASKSKLPVANRIGDMVLALPLHGRMLDCDVAKICDIILGL